MSLSLKNNPWRPNPGKAKEIEEQNKLMEAMRKKAQACLSDDKFQEYKAMFITYRDEVIEHIIILNEEDPIKYAFKIRQLVDTLKAYRLFVSSVEEDATRKAIL